jgi:hypothetical protein
LALLLVTNWYNQPREVDAGPNRDTRTRTIRGKGVSPSRNKRLLRESIYVHKPDTGHRRVTRARFDRAVRLVKKERKSYSGIHLCTKWGIPNRRVNIWLRQRRFILGEDLMRAVRKLGSRFVPTFGAAKRKRGGSATPLGLEAPLGTNESTAWVWGELLDEMIIDECNTGKEAFDKLYAPSELTKGLTVSHTVNHRELMNMLALAAATEGDTGYKCVDGFRQGSTTSLVPYLEEGDKHCWLLVMTPEEVLFINPYGHRDGAQPSEVLRADKAVGSLKVKVGVMDLKLQDDQDMANCRPWVAVMAGIVQIWECYRQAREGATGAELQSGIRDIMTIRELIDLRREPAEGRTNREYIWGYREYMRERLPLRMCPTGYVEGGKHVENGAEPGKLKQAETSKPRVHAVHQGTTVKSGKRKTCEGEGVGGEMSGEETQIIGIV